MRSESGSSQSGDNPGIGQKAEPHENLLGQRAGADRNESAQRAQIKAHMMQIKEIEKTMRVRNGTKAHQKSADGADHGGKRCTPHPQTRKAKIPADQEIIEKDVDQIGHHIGLHGNAGIPRSALGGIDDQGKTGKAKPHR